MEGVVPNVCVKVLLYALLPIWIVQAKVCSIFFNGRNARHGYRSFRLYFPSLVTLGCIIIVFGGRSSYIDPRNESGTDNIRPKFGDSWAMPPILPSADLSSSVRSLSVFTL